MDLPAEDFHHPYTPYVIQLQFMRSLYACLEEGKVAVFESPTGTGKSLSLICGALTWLRDHKRKAFQETVDNTTCDDGEPEWMLDFAKRESSRAITEKRKDLEARLAKTRLEEEKQRQAIENPERPRKKQKFDNSEDKPQDDDQFALDEYDSENEEQRTSTKSSGNFDGLSTSTMALLERFQGRFATQNKDAQDDENEEIKIFFCSRTHSQLSQFARELQRVTIPSSLPKELRTGNQDEDDLEERIKHLSLGSRKNLCINPRVASLGNATAINERCLELQQPGVAADHKCSYLPSKEDEALTLQFRDHALATIKDIEDIGKVGKHVGICPYYASRSVIKHSEIVTLPYPLLLQRSAREALNLSVKDHVIIIDEAHNLMDAISNIHSVTVTLSQLQTSIFQLTTYARKFKNRLKGKNRSYVAQVIRLVSSIADHLRSINESTKPLEGSLQASDLMAGKGVDQINPYKLSRYLQESKLARKVDGYVEFSSSHDDKANNSNNNRQTTDKQPTTPVLFHVQSFLLPLMNPSAEGRLFYLKNQGDVHLRYMLLDPTNHFREIVEDARAVILAGGTMSPMTDYMHHLFSYVPVDRLDTFSYGHVIPAENLAAQSLVRGVTGSEFDFTYEARESEKMVIDLGRTISMLCQVIPNGVVAFFPSYDYLSRVLNIWKKPIPNDKSDSSIINLIEQKKPVLYETRESTASTEELLQEYTNIIQAGPMADKTKTTGKGKGGALLLSVVGGKLSEGINFSDALGRGVLMIGLPFPNIRSAVWQAKIQHVEQKTYNSNQNLSTEESRKSAAKAAGREFYENACMRAVNQCIGRAIRHQNDYAAIVLMDRRYELPRIQGKLPAWIRQSMVAGGGQRSAGATAQDLARFFVGRRRSYEEK